MADQAGTYSIKELTGPGRNLVLSQRALPFRPYTLQGSQRAKVQYYPGSPIGTLQFLGASEEDATINGFWHDKFIADGLTGAEGFVNSLSSFVSDGPAAAAVLGGVPVGSVHDLVQLVDDIRRAGQLLEVAWLHTKRRGYMKKFVQKWHNLHDCEWEITFEWIAQNEEQDSQLAVSTPKTDLPSVAELMKSLSSGMQDAAIPTVPRLFSITQTFATINTAIQTQVDGIQDSINNYVDGVSAPLDTVRGALSQLKESIDQAANMADSIRSRVDSSILVGTTTLAGIAAVAEGMSIAASYSQRQMLQAANKLRRQGIRGFTDLIANTNPDLVVAYYSRANEDLRDVAIRYYGDSEGWRYLMQYNGLKTSSVPVGRIILVPRKREESSV